MKSQPRGLYKGLTFPLASVGLLNGIFFGIYENAKSHLGSSYLSMLIAGSISGAMQAIPGTMIELVKVKLQNQIGKISNKSSTIFLYIYYC